jgi:hypothetical protein
LQIMLMRLYGIAKIEPSQRNQTAGARRAFPKNGGRSPSTPVGICCGVSRKAVNSRCPTPVAELRLRSCCKSQLSFWLIWCYIYAYFTSRVQSESKG